jgi:hypothetical protein
MLFFMFIPHKSVVRARTVIEKVMCSLIPSHHLEKSTDIRCIMYYLLLLSLAISENQLCLVNN